MKSSVWRTFGAASEKTLGVSLMAAALAVSVSGCKKEEPPPPLPTAAPAATTAAPLQLKPEDAGVEVVVDSGVKKPTGVGHGGGGLGPCCAALAQNATMAPEQTKPFMLQAAALCQGLAATGKDKSSAAGVLLGALRGAGLPAACK